VHGADAFIDVEAVRLAPDGKHFGAQFAEYMRRNVIGGSVSAIDHDGDPGQVQLVGKGTFAEFNVTPSGVVDTTGPPQRFRTDTTQGLVDGRFYLGLDVIVQLHALRREELDTVILVRIVRGTDYYTRHQP